MLTLGRSETPWLLAVALATTAPHLAHQPVWLSLLAGGALLWRTWLWQQNAGLPKRWILFLLVTLGVAGIALQFRTIFGRDAGVALLVFFMALKPLEMRQRRDAVVLVMLGFFLLLTHYFYSQSIPTGLWLIASSALLTATLIRLHGGEQPVTSILRYAGLLLAQATPFMLILFLLFPRINGPLWGLPQDAHSGLTGLSERMAPGSLNNLIQSGNIAFRAQFSDAAPQQNQLYWRGPVLDSYDGQSWTRRSLPMRSTSSVQPRIEAGKTSFKYTTTLEAHNQRWLLALDLPLALSGESSLSSRLEALSREGVHNRSRYTFTSSPDAVANRQEAPEILRHAQTLPGTLNPRSRQLAADWREQWLSPEAISNAALRFFRNENFYYTLQPPLLGEHAIDDFMFTTRRGFCEHFAAAYVVLMRAAGIPARVVTGYQGGELNPIDGYLTVRQSDAHAWAEIWIADKGWLRVDPTAAVAPSRIERGISAALPSDESLPALVRIDTDWLRNLRNRWEAANNAWNQWVLGYNPQRQRELLSRLGLRDPDWRSMAQFMAVACALAMVAVSIWTLYQRRTQSPAQRAWKAYCRQLGRFGLVRNEWEGPLAFAGRVAREQKQLGPLSALAAHHYAALHYGTGSTEHLIKLEQCTRQLARMPSPPRRKSA